MWLSSFLARSDHFVRFLFASRPLTDSKQMDFVRQARDLIKKGQFDEAVSADWLSCQNWLVDYLYIILQYLSSPLFSFSLQIHYCEDLIAQAMEGLSYYHTYDRFFLGSSVVLGFIGWTSYVVLFILKTHASLRKPPSNMHMVSKRCRISTCSLLSLQIMINIMVLWFINVKKVWIVSHPLFVLWCSR